MFSLYHGVSVYASFWLTFWTNDPYLTNQTNIGEDKFYDKVKYYLYGYGLLGVIQGILKSLNPVHGEVYSIQHYVIDFVSDLQQALGFQQVLLFPPPIKLTTI